MTARKRTSIRVNTATEYMTFVQLKAPRPVIGTRSCDIREGRMTGTVALTDRVSGSVDDARRHISAPLPRSAFAGISLPCVTNAEGGLM
jgi:hypothetical protein